MSKGSGAIDYKWWRNSKFLFAYAVILLITAVLFFVQWDWIDVILGVLALFCAFVFATHAFKYALGAVIPGLQPENMVKNEAARRAFMEKHGGTLTGRMKSDTPNIASPPEGHEE